MKRKRIHRKQRELNKNPKGLLGFLTLTSLEALCGSSKMHFILEVLCQVTKEGFMNQSVIISK